jgi:adenylate cyclase
MNIFRNLRLKPSILTSFIILTVPVFFTIIAVTYLSNDRIARNNARELVERFRVDAVENIQADFNPIKSLVRSAAAIGERYPDFYLDDRCFTYFHSVLLHSPRIVSVYAGLNDGAFRQSRRIDPTVKIDDRLPPEDAHFAFRWIVPQPGQPLIDHYLFHTVDLKPLGEATQPTNYDPRTRLWYRSAAEARAETISDPDLFATPGLGTSWCCSRSAS